MALLRWLGKAVLWAVVGLIGLFVLLIAIGKIEDMPTVERLLWGLFISLGVIAWLFAKSLDQLDARLRRIEGMLSSRDRY